MTNPVLNDSYVGCPFQIQMCDQQGGISLGTAFFYEIGGGETFIITNWHNVTGKHPITGEQLDNIRTPTYLNAKVAVATSSAPNIEGATMFSFAEHKIEIESQDGQPSWLEHPEFGSLCDTVAIRMDRSAKWPDGIHSSANSIDETVIPIEAGTKVLVIGFPSGVSVGPGLPLIKTGSISSTPGYEVRLGGSFSEVGGMKGGTRLPSMFLDVHTVPGMSGSPVFAEHSGFWNPRGGNLADDDSIIGTSRMFLGCHSSKVLEQEARSGLAICCPASTIEEICQAKRIGRRFAHRDNDTGFSYE